MTAHARFTVRLRSRLTAAALFDAVLDLDAQQAVIPLTWFTDRPARLAAGERFVARTALGPVGFDDPMQVERWDPPAAGRGAGRRGAPAGSGGCTIRKTGRVLGGTVDVQVRPAAGLVRRGSRLVWRQQLDVWWLPRWASPFVALVARLGYAVTLRRLARLAERG